jgi:hypothetical protein
MQGCCAPRILLRLAAGLRHVVAGHAVGRCGQHGAQHIAQLGHHHRRRGLGLAAGILSGPGEDEPLPGAGQGLQEEQAIGVAADRGPQPRAARRQVEAGGPVAARKGTVVHTDQGDDPERDASHRLQAQTVTAPFEEAARRDLLRAADSRPLTASSPSSE